MNKSISTPSNPLEANNLHESTTSLDLNKPAGLSAGLGKAAAPAGTDDNTTNSQPVQNSPAPTTKRQTQEFDSLRSNLSDAQGNKIITLLKDKKILSAVIVVCLLVIVVPVSQMFNKSDDSAKEDNKVVPGDKYSEYLQEGVDEYEAGDYFEARSLFHKAYAESEKQKLTKRKISSALHHLISASAESHEYELAKEYLAKLEKLAGVSSYDKDPDSVEAAETYQDKALLLMAGPKPDLSKAQSLTQKARNFYESHEGFGSEIMRCLSTLGQIKILQGDFEAASSYMNQAVMIAKEDPTVSQLEVAIRMDGLGDAYILLTGQSRGKENYYKQAKEQYTEALKLRKDVVKTDDDKALSQSYLRLGIINYILDDFNDAETDLRTSLSIREKHGSPLQIAEVKRALSKVLLAQKKLPEAKKVFEESIATAKKSGPQIAPQIKKWRADFDNLAKSVR